MGGWLNPLLALCSGWYWKNVLFTWGHIEPIERVLYLFAVNFALLCCTNYLYPWEKIQINVSSFLQEILAVSYSSSFALSSLMDCQIKAHWKNESPCILEPIPVFWHFQTISLRQLLQVWGLLGKKNSENAVNFFAEGFVLYCWRKNISLSVYMIIC